MRIQIFSPFFPDPPQEGGFIVISEQARRLKELGHEIELIYWKGKDPSPSVKADYYRGIRITRLGGDPKVSKFVRVFRSLASRWSSGELYHYPPELKSSLKALIPTDLRILNYSFVGPFLPMVGQKTVVVFHNLEADLYEQKSLAEPNGLFKFIHQLNAKKLGQHEEELSSLCEELWFLSPKDQQDYLNKLQGKFPSPKIRNFPPFFSQAYLQQKRSLRRSPKASVIGFVGGMDFRPNQVSARWIVEQVAPNLEKLNFKGTILMMGKNPPSDLLKLALKFPFIQFHGFVANLNSYWSEVSLSLSPHLEGSGIRIKLLESLATGVPVITHLAARDQLSPSLKSHPQLRFSDSAQEWAQLIVNGDLSQLKPTAESDLALITPSDFLSG